MSKPIQNPRVADALAREYNLVGRVRPILDEVVIPTVLVGDVRATLPARRRTAMASFTQGAVAGEFGGFRLEIPPGMIVSLDGWWTLGGGNNLRVNLGAAQLTAPANTANETFLDAMFAAQGTPACALTFGTQVAAIAAAARLDLVPNFGPQTFPVPLIGQGLQGAFGFIEFQEVTANTAIGNLGVFWTEYLPY